MVLTFRVIIIIIILVVVVVHLRLGASKQRDEPVKSNLDSDNTMVQKREKHRKIVSKRVSAAKCVRKGRRAEQVNE